MTLSLALLNTEQAVLVSDHRLSVDGRPQDTEMIKNGVCMCSNARAGYGFSGLATAKGFRADLWFLGSFTECGKPDFMIGSILERLRLCATRDIARIPVKKPEDRRLSIALAGYDYSEEPPRGFLALLSNFERWGQRFVGDPLPEFELHTVHEKRPMEFEPAVIGVLGAGEAVERGDVERLSALLEERAPAKQLVAEAVQVIRRTARSPRAQGTVGERCFSITLPRDPNAEPAAENHLDAPSAHMYDFPRAIATPELAIAFGEPSLTSDSANAEWVPRVGRNKPCACGSGKKYKHCHGS
jgi:hypothetical protein